MGSGRAWGKPAAGRSRRTPTAFPCLSYTPVLRFKPKITLIRWTARFPSNSAMTRWPRCASRCPMWSGTPRRTRGRVLVGVDMTAKTLTLQVEDNGVGIDRKSRSEGATPPPGPAPPAGTPRSRGAPSRGPPSPGWHSRLRESGSRSPMLPGVTQQSAPTFSGRQWAYGLWSGPGGLSAPDLPESASATVGAATWGAATWPRRLVMRMLRTNWTAVGSGVRGGRS